MRAASLLVILAVVAAGFGCERSEPPKTPTTTAATPAVAAPETQEQAVLTEIAGADASKVGTDLLALIQKGPDDGGVARFIGKVAAFKGGAAPPGGNADLLIAKGVRLQVVIVPYRDVRPQAVYWSASVVGIIKTVDAKQKVITIEVKPNNFVVFETM